MTPDDIRGLYKCFAEMYIISYKRTLIREFFIIFDENEDAFFRYMRRKGICAALKGAHVSGAVRRSLASYKMNVACP